MKKYFLLIVLFALNLNANTNYHNSNYEIDHQKTDDLYKVQLISGKKNDRRFYQVKRDENFKYDLEVVFKSITNFTEKCNNDFRNRRKLTSKEKNCKYHNSNLVESIIHRELIKGHEKEPNESERYIISRRIYNSDDFSHNDLIKVYRFQENGVSYIKITQQMLLEKEAKEYISNPVKTNSAFDKTYGEYILKSLEDNSTQVSFTYSSETTHWLLNKSVAVSKVFTNMTKSFDLLFESIGTESKLITVNKTKTSKN